MQMLVNKNICKHNLRNIPIRALAENKKIKRRKVPLIGAQLCVGHFAFMFSFYSRQPFRILKCEQGLLLFDTYRLLLSLCLQPVCSFLVNGVMIAHIEPFLILPRSLVV